MRHSKWYPALVALMTALVACSGGETRHSRNNNSSGDGGSGGAGGAASGSGGAGGQMVMIDTCSPGSPGGCAANSTCYAQGGTVGVCFESCGPGGPCPAGQLCGEAPQGGGVCVPECDANGGCAGPSACSSGICFPSCQLLPGLCAPGKTCVGSFTCLTPEGAPPGTPCIAVTGAPIPKLMLDLNKTLGALTPPEAEQLCDWAAAKVGDYNCTEQCGPNVTVTYKGSRAECVASLTKPGCTATVSQAISCINATIKDLCDPAGATGPECQPLAACP